MGTRVGYEPLLSRVRERRGELEGLEYCGGTPPKSAAIEQGGSYPNTCVCSQLARDQLETRISTSSYT